MALNKRTREVWNAQVQDRAGYAATIVAEMGGVRHYVASLTGGLAGIAASDGRLLWRYQKTGNRFTTPIVTGDLLFSANGYGAGMSLLKLVRDGESIVAQEQYHQSFNFDAFQDNAVLVGDHVYACQASGLPVCLELKTGKTAWGPIRTALKGRVALTYADGHLYLRGSAGLMILAEASPKEYVEKGSFQIPEPTAASGATFPVIAARRLYVRDNDKLLAYDISRRSKPRAGPEPWRGDLHGDHQPGEAAPPLSGRTAPDAIFVRF